MSARKEGNEHWSAAAIGSIGFGTELLTEKTFFETRFHPKARNNEKRAGKCVKVAFQNGDGHGGENDARVNGMADDPVRPRIDDPVFVFARDKGGPEFPEMESGPLGKRKSYSGQGGHDPSSPLRQNKEMARRAPRIYSEKEDVTRGDNQAGR